MHILVSKPSNHFNPVIPLFQRSADDGLYIISWGVTWNSKRVSNFEIPYNGKYGINAWRCVGVGLNIIEGCINGLLFEGLEGTSTG